MSNEQEESLKRANLNDLAEFLINNVDKSPTHRGYTNMALAKTNNSIVLLAERINESTTQIVQSNKMLLETINDSTNRIIDSNTSLSKSTDRISTIMARLTGALVFIGFVQVIVAILQFLRN